MTLYIFQYHHYIIGLFLSSIINHSKKVSSTFATQSIDPLILQFHLFFLDIL